MHSGPIIRKTCNELMQYDMSTMNKVIAVTYACLTNIKYYTNIDYHTKPLFPIPAVDNVQDKVEEVDIPQKHIEALERINAITIMDRLTYNMHKQCRNAEEVCGICMYVLCVSAVL